MSLVMRLLCTSKLSSEQGVTNRPKFEVNLCLMNIYEIKEPQCDFKRSLVRLCVEFCSIKISTGNIAVHVWHIIL